MVGWHHRLIGYGFGWTPGVSDGQGGLVCGGSWGHKESDTTSLSLSSKEQASFNFMAAVCLVKAMVFSVVMYGCEIWTIKKAEC